MSVAKTILAQLRPNTSVFWSWGVPMQQGALLDMGEKFTLNFGENNEPRTFNVLGGLMFSTNGYLHKGKVLIVLEGSDTYTVHLLKQHRSEKGPYFTIVKSLEGVYCDMLQTVVDANVERDPKIYAKARQ